METKEMTVKDVLTDVNKVLNGINIPISMLESIGMPIARAISGISICINAITEEEQKQETEAAAADTETEDKGEKDA